MRKSMTAGILVMFAGYAAASYGYVLLRGWDIPWRGWIDPLHAYVFSGTPSPIAKGQVFPHAATASTPGSGGGGN